MARRAERVGSGRKRRGEPRIHRNEAADSRLRALADSINDTARMVRPNLTLAMVATLCLGVTLMASTDENLLRNGQVMLPQVGIGISLVQSYLFLPPVFVFLHSQLLLLLTILERKLRAYQAVLDNEQVPAVRRNEYWEWLSGFAFVQVYRTERSILHPLRMLSWLGTNVVPLGLLALVVVSFVRYQSDEITLCHKALFAVDLGMVALFTWRMHRPRWRNPGDWAGFLWRTLRQGVAVIFAIGLLWYAEPPRYAEEARVDPDWQSSNWELWRGSDAPESQSAGRMSLVQRATEFWNGTVTLAGDAWDGQNMLDAGPCEWWGFACRYLDTRGAQLVERRAEDRFGLRPSKPDDKELAALRRAYSEPLDLSGRNLRFARLDNAFLPGANLAGADLRGAAGRGVDLTVADTQSAGLQGAVLSGAQLQGAYLSDAQLQGAYLSDAQLQGAYLQEAQLQGAFGRPAGWRLAWMRGARFGFAPLTDQPEGGTLSQRAEHELSQILTDEMRVQKVRWQIGDVSVADQVRERLLEGVKQGLFSGGKPETGDWVSYATDADLPEHERPPEGWPVPPDLGDPAYWQAWAEWTVPFACESEFTAKASLRRWGKGGLSEMPNGPLKDTVRAALIAKHGSQDDCPGLKAVPAAEWQRFVEGR